MPVSSPPGTTAPVAALTPLERQSVRRTLRTPSLLRTEALAAVVVALALIPEAIAFSIIAGVDPRVGLFASFAMAVTTAIVGGRPAMISASTGAVALVVAPLSHAHGFDHLIAAIMLGGLIQVVLGLAGVARLMRFVPRSVMVGFVNALAILVFTAQLPELVGVPWLVYPLTAAALAIVVLLPRLTTAIPATLAAVVAVTAVVMAAGWDVPRVGDRGALPDAPPTLFLPDVPPTWDTFTLILPFSLGMAFVGLLESLLTAKLVDDLTDTRSDKAREAWGQGVANVVSGLTGGMGGCAVVGQTMMNVKANGARTRLSTFLAGVFLLVLVVALGDLVAQIPMAALVGVMVFVSAATFDWHSVRPATLRAMPRSETAVMVVTVLATVVTHNLAVGVGVGVLTATLLFAQRVSRLARVDRHLDDDGARVVYRVTGQLFFASSNDLYSQFEYALDPERVVIDLSEAHVWDASTVAALDAVVTKYAQHGAVAEVRGLEGESAAMHARLTGRTGA